VIFANASLGVILGRPVEELLGSRLADVLAPLDASNVLERLTVDSDERERTELAVSRPDGVRRVLEVSASARREGGVAAGFQAVVRDVTAEHDLGEAKNEFLALITHDLRNPLTAILGLGATLETHADELPVDRIQSMGQSVRRQAERIARLADDLFDVSRLEARSIVLNVRPVDIGLTVELALASVPDPAAVELRIPPDLRALADSRRLEQAVANLIENALLHGAAPVIVEAAAADGEVVLSVRDHGAGVAELLVPTLFSRIRTLSRRDRDRAGGTGLGLALVRGLVEAMGGRVGYEPAPGGGALFFLALPLPRPRA
jgi:two-component system, OmpR family, sensor histidine kinase MtrB